MALNAVANNPPKITPRRKNFRTRRAPPLPGSLFLLTPPPHPPPRSSPSRRFSHARSAVLPLPTGLPPRFPLPHQFPLSPSVPPPLGFFSHHRADPPIFLSPTGSPSPAAELRPPQVSSPPPVPPLPPPSSPLLVSSPSPVPPLPTPSSPLLVSSPLPVPPLPLLSFPPGFLSPVGSPSPITELPPYPPFPLPVNSPSPTAELPLPPGFLSLPVLPLLPPSSLSSLPSPHFLSPHHRFETGAAIPVPPSAPSSRATNFLYRRIHLLRHHPVP